MIKRPHSLPVRLSFGMSLLAIILLALSSQAQTSRTVSWSQDKVSQTIGNGAAVPATEIRFTVSSPINDASISVVPGVAKYVSVESVIPSTLVPNTEYVVRLGYSLPPNAIEGSYSGTIHIKSGGRTVPKVLAITVNVDFDGNTPSTNVRTLSRPTLGLISGITPDGRGIYFAVSNPELAALTAGNILALPPAAFIQNGFLGKITGIVPFGSGILIETISASLSEAFNNAHVSLDKNLDESDVVSNVALASGVSFRQNARRGGLAQSDLTASMNDLVLYDGDGNTSTTNDQVRMDGSVTIDPDLHFSFDIDDGHLEQLAFTIGLNQSSEVTVKSTVSYDFLDAEREFANTRFGTIVIWVGWVPVVIVPEASLVAQVSGSASVGLQVGITQSANASVGFGYSNGSWQGINNFSNSFNFSPPTFTAGVDVKGEAGPRFELLLYGVVGPHADLTAYVEFDADLFRTPIWQLYGGLEASAGVSLEIFDHTIADHEFPLLIQQRILLAEGGIASDGEIVGVVKDAVSNQTLPNATINVFRDGDLIDTILTNASGGFTIPALTGAVYKLNFTRSGYLPATYNDITVLPGETRTLDVILQISEENGGNGTVSGKIVNALSGVGVPGLTMDLRLGINTKIGPIAASTSTVAGGDYSISNLPAGNYTAEVRGTGYSTVYFTILCIGNMTSPNQNGVISPVLPSNQIRIVLTWGANPSDLDSHFFGPLADGTQFHMYYPYSGGSSPWPSVVNLDLDDVTSFGPETTTLFQQFTGTYKFSVHDYTNRSSTTSSALSASQAQVRLYKGADLIANFNVPLNQAATLWEVFELEGDTVRPLNNMLFSSAPTSLGEENLFRSLPVK
ncbi:MAG: carboxypeptidase regulatory-like domain-containing protein [Pyrinomonadaceae bacterium]